MAEFAPELSLEPAISTLASLAAWMPECRKIHAISESMDFMKSFFTSQGTIPVEYN